MKAHKIWLLSHVKKMQSKMKATANQRANTRVITKVSGLIKFLGIQVTVFNLKYNL